MSRKWHLASPITSSCADANPLTWSYATRESKEQYYRQEVSKDEENKTTLFRQKTVLTGQSEFGFVFDALDVAVLTQPRKCSAPLNRCLLSIDPPYPLIKYNLTINYVSVSLSYS